MRYGPGYLREVIIILLDTLIHRSNHHSFEAKASSPPVDHARTSSSNSLTTRLDGFKLHED